MFATNPTGQGDLFQDPGFQQFFQGAAVQQGQNVPQQFRQQQDSDSMLAGEPNLCKNAVTGCLGCCALPIGIALFVIGCCAAAGTLTGVVAGGCAVALSIPLLILILLTGRKNPVLGDITLQFVVGIISHLAMIVIGSLAIAGIVSATTVGYVFLGIQAAGLIYNCIQYYRAGGFRQVMGMLA